MTVGDRGAKMRRHIARCDLCSTTVESRHPWDTATCGCGALTISGGVTRPHVAWTAAPGAGWTDLSEYEEDGGDGGDVGDGGKAEEGPGHHGGGGPVPGSRGMSLFRRPRRPRRPRGTPRRRS